MRRYLVPFFASAIVSGLVCAATQAQATNWWRTVDGAACNPSDPDSVTHYYKSQDCPFVSDTISGATSLTGNGATTIYADYVVGEAHVEDLYISACAHAFNGTDYACGTSVHYASQNNGTYDVSLPLWKGTQSHWDYFRVRFQISNGGYLRPTGIAATGTN
jgi:hypothetical protein